MALTVIWWTLNDVRGQRLKTKTKKKTIINAFDERNCATLEFLLLFVFMNNNNRFVRISIHIDWLEIPLVDNKEHIEHSFELMTNTEVQKTEHIIAIYFAMCGVDSLHNIWLSLSKIYDFLFVKAINRRTKFFEQIIQMWQNNHQSR